MDPQNWSGRYGEVKIFYPTGTRNLDPFVVQPIGSRYADYATTVLRVVGYHFYINITSYNLFYWKRREA
jgi:hypothetical protein